MSDQKNPANINRRTLLLAAAGAAPLALGATSAKAAKLAQKAVRYQDSPKDGKRCDGCNLFVAPDACKSVEGPISPSGWCALWVKKAGCRPLRRQTQRRGSAGQQEALRVTFKQRFDRHRPRASLAAPTITRNGARDDG